MYIINRLGVNIDEETTRQIEHLIAVKGIDRTEATRRAFALYFEVVNKIRAGYTVEFVNKDEGKQEVLVLL